MTDECPFEPTHDVERWDHDTSDPMSSVAAFVLDFGKYKGKTLAEVPIGYLRWIITTKKDKNQQYLKRAARIAKTYIAHCDGKNKPEPYGTTVFFFGKYKGKTLDEVYEEAESYLWWVKERFVGDVENPSFHFFGCAVAEYLKRKQREHLDIVK